MLKVLCVDDERIIREGLVSAIDWESYGFVVAGTCKNGKEALDFIKASPPDLVITDIKIPILNGIELIGETYQHNPKIKFIIISGFGEFEFAHTAMKYGVKHYLLKPYTADKLIHAIEDIKKELGYYTKQSNSSVELTNKKLSHWIKEILKYVDLHLDCPELSLKKIAQQVVHVNPGYLSRIFNKEMGESFPHYVMRLRMELAKKLIVECENDKMYQVADKIGLAGNTQYFSQVFKNYTGLTPSEYRAKNNN